ncbi:Clathrin light chain 2 [Hibiscus syriacus]|uniref:Clathrin light chain n=1 Tax=Hibiscus syriacus TaxID=106335 RepID=A0A6A2YPP3_HIBSY|nr:clathrin light chain 2-like [Hibiscus syriacus]KAE8681235.1 Clathrin light chain 2 [Hibiscus syriacus]
MSTFADSFTQLGDDSMDSFDSVPHQEEDTNGYDGYDPSQQFDSFADQSDHPKGSTHDMFAPDPYTNGVEFGQDFDGLNGPILPPPEMEPEEGVALREWRRENAIRLEEKEKKEKELLSQIIDEADQFKVEFYKKRELTCQNNKASNREREKIFVANHEKFHAETDKHYWKAIAELIPNEVPTIEKRGKKDKVKKPSIVVVQGPKPGKPTDRSRMRQILVKLKHDTPPHLKHTPPPPPPPPVAAPAKDQDAKSSNTSVPAATPVTSSADAIVAA